MFARINTHAHTRFRKMKYWIFMGNRIAFICERVFPDVFRHRLFPFFPMGYAVPIYCNFSFRFVSSRFVSFFFSFAYENSILSLICMRKTGRAQINSTLERKLTRNRSICRSTLSFINCKGAHK